MEVELIQCNKCLKKYPLNSHSNKIYDGIDEHHNPPKFTFDGEEWVGKFYNLCRACHKELHQKVIIPILNGFSTHLKFNGSEYWLWKNILPKDKIVCRQKIYSETMGWLNEST